VAVGRLDGRLVRHQRYTAWGHPDGNDREAQVTACHNLLGRLWRDPAVDLVFHHAKFDLDVAEVHLGLPLPPWQRVHDTVLELYLDDPRLPSFALKPAAHQLLGLVPEERDAVRDWLVTQGIVRKTDPTWGAHIWEAPPTVVGPYALGDVARTAGLHRLLQKRLAERDLTGAYARERQLMPVLLANEREGIRVDLELLATEEAELSRAFARVEAWLRKRLDAPEVDLDSDEQLANTLDAAGVVAEWLLTEKGSRSTAAKNLRLTDPRVRDSLAYRGQLATCLRTFMRPWLAQATGSKGWLYTNWNQVRGENDLGTKTGRLSSNPSKMNIPNEFKPLKHLPLKLPPLPQCRRYVIGDAKNHLVLSCDYSQQELRALGHFEDGPLLEAYQAQPKMDIHDHARNLINRMLNTNLDRKPIKNMGFGLIYGMGLAKLASQMGVDEEMAKTIKRAYLTIFPGLKELNDDLKRRARLGLPIRTWGGREYLCEPPKMVKGKLRTFEYKMLNLLIQGSSADCTKEAMLRYDAVKEEGRFLLQVHDQILVSVPKHNLKRETQLLRDAMQSVEFDVPMLVDASAGPSWAELKEI
jgi:DNA polymerase-1